MDEASAVPPEGDRIGQGRTAEVFAIDESRVLKLLKPGFDAEAVSVEAARTAAANAAGAPAPLVHDIVEIEGRGGIVLERIEGDSLLDDITIEPFKLRSWAHLLGDGHAAILVHRTSELPDLKDVYTDKIERADLSSRQRDVVLRTLASLPDGEAVLHGDVHPGNLIRTPDRSVFIDWIDAARGDPAADVARTLWLLSPATVSEANPNRRTMTMAQGVFRRTYRSRVLKQIARRRRDVDAWGLPVAAARLSEGIPHEEAALRREIDRRIDR